MLFSTRGSRQLDVVVVGVWCNRFFCEEWANLHDHWDEALVWSLESAFKQGLKLAEWFAAFSSVCFLILDTVSFAKCVEAQNYDDVLVELEEIVKGTKIGARAFGSALTYVQNARAREIILKHLPLLRGKIGQPDMYTWRTNLLVALGKPAAETTGKREISMSYAGLNIVVRVSSLEEELGPCPKPYLHHSTLHTYQPYPWLSIYLLYICHYAFVAICIHTHIYRNIYI
jgi:hypothetical protein